MIPGMNKGGDLREVRVRSLTGPPDTLYSVMATEDGKAVSCTCPAGQHNTPCKHLYRVTAVEVFKKAMNHLLREGIFESSQVAQETFFRWQNEENSVEKAMARVIRRAFPAHPLAEVNPRSLLYAENHSE